MAEDKGTWSELFAGSGLTVWVFAGGVGLQSIEIFIVSTLLPSVVREIGGMDLFAWNTTLFIVASIMASVFAAVRPFNIGSRGSYLIAAAAFGLGSLIAGLAPDIWVMLAGRTVQGFGAGLLVAMTFAMIRIVFPERLWSRAMALISAVWGVSTLIGPAIGGVFAQFDIWRWAFLSIVPLAILLGIGALRVLPRDSGTDGMAAVPLRQIMLVVTAVLAVSVASLVTSNLVLSIGLLALAVLAVIALGLIDRNAHQRLLPSGTFSLGSALGPLFATMLLLQMAIVSDVFAPLFLQRLHGLEPIVAGYVVALVAAGWSTGSIVVSGWQGNKARFLIATGSPLMLAGALGLALFLTRINPEADLAILVPLGISLFAMGIGIGVSIQKLTERVFAASPVSENNLTSAALTMVQLFASGLGAAAGGLIVNAAGLPQATTLAEAQAPALWLYWLFALIPALAVPLALWVTRVPWCDPAPCEPALLPAE